MVALPTPSPVAARTIASAVDMSTSPHTTTVARPSVTEELAEKSVPALS
jgi:hypothetical protein